MKIEIMRKEEFSQLATSLIEQTQSLLEKQRDLVYDYLNEHPSVFLNTAIKLSDDSLNIILDEDSLDGLPESVIIQYEKGNTIVPLDVIGILKNDCGDDVSLYWVNEYGEVDTVPMEDMPMSNYGTILQLLMEGEDWYIGDVFYK